MQTEPESLQQPIADIQAFIKTHLNFSFSCALSDIGTFSDFKSQYAQVHDLIQQRFFRGESCIILPDDAAQTTDFLPIKSVQQLQQPLLDKLRLQDYAGCEKPILSALEKCREAPVPRIFQLINQINAVIEEYVFTQSESHGEMYLPSTPGDLLKELDYAETYAEVCEGYHHIFAQLSADDQKERDGGSAYLQLIAEVKKAVDEQYTDPNLSLQSLSERFPFSSVYLGRIFRREVGCSVATYINKVRMEHAAELLRGTHLSVTEIAAACGIENSSYFYTLFKKQFGMTPNEYKRLHPNPPSES